VAAKRIGFRHLAQVGREVFSGMMLAPVEQKPLTMALRRRQSSFEQQVQKNGPG
jgi:hypothetical protein